MRADARLAAIAVVLAIAVHGSNAVADSDLASKFLNQGSVANTRHNLTQRQPNGGGPAGAIMDPYRNDYGEVCVYCHTPHGANADVQLPLWNRTLKPTVYQTYDTLRTTTLTQPVSQPGPNSLSCLSCHDGQTAVDSIINMPGSGGYNRAQATAQDNGFLNAWNNSRGPDATVHIGLSPDRANGCLACHSPAAGVVGAGATDFTVFAISTDLRNDHPVGIRYPLDAPVTDFNTPNATRGDLKFFDTNGDGRPDTKEVRLYSSSGEFRVECASCHDPHGVPASGAGGAFNASFLRVANIGSALCMTCHVK